MKKLFVLSKDLKNIKPFLILASHAVIEEHQVEVVTYEACNRDMRDGQWSRINTGNVKWEDVTFVGVPIPKSEGRGWSYDCKVRKIELTEILSEIQNLSDISRRRCEESIADIIGLSI